MALTFAYFALALLWQAVLWTALPNVGMGGLAVLTILWPLIGLSAICLWFALRHSSRYRSAIFILAIAAMLLVSLWSHPQDSPLGLGQKLAALSRGA